MILKWIDAVGKSVYAKPYDECILTLSVFHENVTA